MTQIEFQKAADLLRDVAQDLDQDDARRQDMLSMVADLETSVRELRERVNRKVEMDFGLLSEIDNGVINETLKKQIGHAQNDIVQAPYIEKNRTVDVKLHMFPIMEEGNLKEIGFQIKMPGVKLPERQSGIYKASRDRHSNAFGVRLGSPDNPDQQSLEY